MPLYVRWSRWTVPAGVWLLHHVTFTYLFSVCLHVWGWMDHGTDVKFRGNLRSLFSPSTTRLPEVKCRSSGSGVSHYTHWVILLAHECTQNTRIPRKQLKCQWENTICHVVPTIHVNLKKWLQCCMWVATLYTITCAHTHIHMYTYMYIYIYIS